MSRSLSLKNRKERLKDNYLRWKEKYKERRFYRICPKCGKLLIYKRKRQRDRFEKEDKFCISCTTKKRHFEGCFPYINGGLKTQESIDKASKTCLLKYGVPYSILIVKDNLDNINFEISLRSIESLNKAFNI